ncbi:hypothetical protein jhhlp_005350 [Lomentospora prolificans]|uniref:DUF8021 domain-containing protein n=1 Tax=Lomentospora prolificans TaxID=41688 RepID=A0A2N3N7J4_9PEZI|nr:hypothetical protein jhhlp_005350 [Lomentospora prolificans]
MKTSKFLSRRTASCQDAGHSPSLSPRHIPNICFIFHIHRSAIETRWYRPNLRYKRCQSQSIMKTLIFAGALASTIIAAPFAQGEPECSREALIEAADAYVAAQAAGSLESLVDLLAEEWIYWEDNEEIDPSTAVLSTKALKIDNRRTIADVVECASYTEIIAADPSNPYVIGTQIRHGADFKITKIDTVASTTNSWVFDAKKTLDYVVKEDWFEIPEADRDDRNIIKAAGDAYLDIWSNATAADAVPWGTPCTRLEGSAYTGRGTPQDSCAVGLPSNHNQAPNSNRRYVVDEVMGSVNILCVWEHMMNAADSHEFRLEKGKLRYVHTMTVCGGQVCRL